MPREREFSETDVIDQAADLFSVHGFGGTSVAMLTEATGLGKQSLYNAFGDKQALYLRAVDCATDRYAAVATRMAAASTGRAALEIFCTQLIDSCSSGDAAAKSCIVSAGLLEGVDDPAIRETLRSKWQASHELVRASIERGQRDGSVRSPAPSAALADVVMSMMSGLRVVTRTDDSRERIATVCRLTLSLLDQH
jgi:TetR/AcrR family transcriptional regulator, transcriptional repressor for nem operon